MLVVFFIAKTLSENSWNHQTPPVAEAPPRKKSSQTASWLEALELPISRLLKALSPAIFIFLSLMPSRLATDSQIALLIYCATVFNWMNNIE